MLYPASIILLIANLIALVLSALRPSSKWLRWWPVGLAVVALLQLVIDGFYQTLILVYVITAILIVIGLYQWKVPAKKSKSRVRAIRIGWTIIWQLVFVICLAVSVILTWSFGKTNSLKASLFMGSHTDFSQLGWSESFDHLNAHLAKNYAFGEWKSINWDSLHTCYKPQIVAAEQAADTAAYYLALRQYVFSIPDGHVGLGGNKFGLGKAAIGGGFGFALIQLDDNRVVAHILQENGPAQKAGMAWGAEILTWNNQPILNTLEKVSTLWSSSPCATMELQHIRKLNLLSRAPVGDSIAITFQNPDETFIRKASLIAIDDSMKTLTKDLLMGSPLISMNAFMKTVESQILPNGYGYLKITMEMPTLGTLNPVGAVRNAIDEFKNANVHGVVIDVRLNFGGIDEMTPMMMAPLMSKTLFYEQVAMMDEKTGQPKVIGDISLQPDSSPYTGPVAVLISNNTGSTGEGFPLIMKLANRGKVIGFHSTNGSFGMAGATVKLPGGYTVNFPNGASLDKNGKIQIDSNHLLQGGVAPDVRIPITMESLKAIYVDGKDYMLDAAIAALEADTKK